MGFSHGLVVIEMDSMPPQPGDDLEPEIDRFLRVVRHLADASQWERLLEVARRRMEQSPADEVAHRAAALALIRLRRGSEAGIHVDCLLKEDPEHAFHHELAAQVAMQCCDFRLAEEHLKTGLALDPDKSALHFLTVSVKTALGDPEEAHRHARRLQELEGDNAQSWLSQDVALEGTPQDAKSMAERIQALEKALVHAPERAFLLWRVGRLLLRLEQPAAAQQWLSRAMAGDPLNKHLAADWREAIERSHLVYRCLSFPWRSWQRVRRFFLVLRVRPDIWPHALVLSICWGLLLPWWLLSWGCLAPLGGLVRYFMLLHPAFDFRWPSRHWLRSFSAGRRVGFMVTVLLLILAALCLVMPWEYPLGWAGLAAVQLFLQVYFKSAAIQARRDQYPSAPSSWLNPGCSQAS